MVIYNNENERNDAAVNYINDGLKKGFHCIYASVGAYDSESRSSISNLSFDIDNYKENIERGELRIVDFKPYYESALNADFRPFKKLVTEVEETLNQRKSEGKKDAILIFADAACFLLHNKHFDECEILEWWWSETTTEWRQKNKHITVICPHNGVILNNPLLSETRIRIGSMHTITIDLNQSPENQNNKKKKTKRILVVESEPDIQYIYSLFTKHYGFSPSDVNIVENGNKCLEYIFSNTDYNSDNEYDIIIIDTHLPDISGFEVAKRIRDKLPNKRIILTTTYSLNNIRNRIDSLGIKSEDVILKPFIFSELLYVIEER
jgi:CheY-like chemotaxis protein